MKIITSLTNPIIKDIKKLEQKKYRELFGASLIYNDKVIDLGIKHQQVLCIISTSEQIINPQIKQICVSKQVLKKIHPNHNTTNLAIVKLQNKKLNKKLQKVLVLDDIKDPGNLASIFRSALAFGIKDIIISKHSCDINSCKVMVASAGSIFSLNIYEVDSIYKYLQSSTLPIITTFLDEDMQIKNPIDEFNLVIGNETRGINTQIKTLKHLNYKINTNFESLNVSVASGIIMYNLCKE